jgi:hypothetical protein
MKRIVIDISIFSIVLLMLICLSDCKKTENPIKYPLGTFPDTVINLSDINSAYDDYNAALFELYGDIQIVFSSNRGSSGGQFDLEQGIISVVFDQTNGNFSLGSEVTDDLFLANLFLQAITSGNDFGPYRFFSSLDGFEYLLLSSTSGEGDLDFYYLKHLPSFGTSIPSIEGPFPASLLNTFSDDAYICFDTNKDTVYFSSNRDGNFEVFMHSRPSESNIDTWLNLEYASSVKVDSINSTDNDKCPFILRNVMVFASDRPGGIGGYDLYYSSFRNGKWSSPVNFGPDINTTSDEYRPVIGSHQDFTNNFMIYSSNRAGGKGGYDLYFTGVEFPD